MSRVCTDIYPKGYSYNKFNGFYLEPNLKAQLDILIKNIKKDWDFTVIITGGGEVRTGKSMLAMQIGAYWMSQINKQFKVNHPFTRENNFVYDGLQLIERGNYLGQNHKYSPLVYDEAGADLSSQKIAKALTKQVMDYFRECGQYNLINILVLPDFFDLPKSIAITRSIFLIDVTYIADERQQFKRGYFKFYSRPNKKMLYLKGKKFIDYNAHKYDFRGRFLRFYPIDEKDYRQAKQDALQNRAEPSSVQDLIWREQRDATIFLLMLFTNFNIYDLAVWNNKMTSLKNTHWTYEDLIKKKFGEFFERLDFDGDRRLNLYLSDQSDGVDDGKHLNEKQKLRNHVIELIKKMKFNYLKARRQRSSEKQNEKIILAMKKKKDE